MLSPEEISEAGIEAHEKFAKDQRDMDWYWLNGRLPEWIAKQIEEDKASVNSDSGNLNT